MPVGRPDFWYGQVLLFESAPTDGRTDAGPTSDWAFDHKADAAAHHAAFVAVDADTKIATHTAIAAAHHAAFVAADAAALIATHTAIAAAHHAAFVAADAAALIATHTAIAAAHHAAFVAADAAALIATHTAIAAAHHAAFVSADAAALILTHKNIAAAHHAKTVSGDIDHGGVGGLADDDHTQYLHLSTERSLLQWLKFVNQTILVRIYKDATPKFQWRSDPDGVYPFVIYNETTTTYIFSIDSNGNIITVGTVDGVDLAGGVFINRGNVTVYDKNVANFTLDNAYHDWDLGGYAPAGTKAFLLRVRFVVSSGTQSVYFRCNGFANEINVVLMTHTTGTAMLSQDVIVQCDANRIIEYKVDSANVSVLSVVVAGWWK